jgi:hypothetical protein
MLKFLQGYPANMTLRQILLVTALAFSPAAFPTEWDGVTSAPLTHSLLPFQNPDRPRSGHHSDTEQHLSHCVDHRRACQFLYAQCHAN